VSGRDNRPLRFEIKEQRFDCNSLTTKDLSEEIMCMDYGSYFVENYMKNVGIAVATASIFNVVGEQKNQ
jgi:hypothetical protein